MPAVHAASVTARCTNVRGRSRVASSGTGSPGDSDAVAEDLEDGVAESAATERGGEAEGVLAMLRRR